jgi:hypothetical protein
MSKLPDREREALDEIARTRIRRGGAVTLLATLAALLVTGPAIEAWRHRAEGTDVFRGAPSIPGPARLAGIAGSAGLKAANSALRDGLLALEDRMGRDSALSAALRPRAQWHLFHDLGYGNSQVVVGRDGFLDFQVAFEHLTGPPFLAPRDLARRRAAAAARAPLEPDPRPGVLRLSRDLARRGIRLLFFPVPVKSEIHPEPLLRGGGLPAPKIGNPSTRDLLTDLEAAGVATYDAAEELRAAALAGETVYFKTDTHWNPRGMEIAARGLARTLRERGLVEERPPAGLETRRLAFEFQGDLAKLLGLGTLDVRVPREKPSLRGVTGIGGAPFGSVRPEGDVLLLGDSYSVVFSFDDQAAFAGFPAQLAYELDRPVKKVAKAAANTLDHRVRWLRDDPSLLDGVHTVVYEVTARALSVNDWTPVPLDPPRKKKRRSR